MTEWPRCSRCADVVQRVTDLGLCGICVLVDVIREAETARARAVLRQVPDVGEERAGQPHPKGQL